MRLTLTVRIRCVGLPDRLHMTLVFTFILSCNNNSSELVSYSFSDANERPETENGTIYSHDSGFEGEYQSGLPASPATIPRLRIGSASKRDRPRRQRTTSTSQNTIRPNEAIIRVSNNRTIYTAGTYN